MTGVSLQMKFGCDYVKSFTVFNGRREVYIPRSLVDYRRKWREGDGTEMIDFTIPEWLVKEKGLEKFVTG